MADISRTVPFRDGNLELAYRQTSDGLYAPVFLEGDPVMKKYSVSLAAAEDSIVETAIASAAIPANDWQDHQSMILDLWLRFKKDVAYAGAGVPIKFKYGASSSTIDTILGASFDTTAREQRYRFEARRIGTSIYLYNTDLSVSVHAPSAILDATGVTALAWTTGTGNAILAAQAFTSDKDLQITAQWDAAHANNIVECISATFIKL